MKTIRDDISKFAQALRSDGLWQALYDTSHVLLWRDYSPWRAIANRRREEERLDREWDEAMGVETCGDTPLRDVGVPLAEVSRGNTVYRPVPQNLFGRAISRLVVDCSQYTFIDFGSGKGKALLLASEYPFAEIIGIEYARALHDTAERNLATYKSRTQRCQLVKSFHLDAMDYVFPDRPLVCFFNNPFDDRTLVRVLRSLRRSWQEKPRRIFVVYVNMRDVKEKLSVLSAVPSLSGRFVDDNVAIFEFSA